MTNPKNGGFISIALSFILGLTAILIGLSLLKTSYAEDWMGRDTAASAKAFYIANSGIEEALHQVSINNPNPFELEIGEGKATVTITGDDTKKEIAAVGVYEKFIRKIKVTIENTSVLPGFAHAIHAGEGGIELRNQTMITNINPGQFGNVYSNSFIKAAKNDFKPGTGECKNSASIVNGSAWAVTEITKLANTDSGPCVTQEAYAANVNYCFVKGRIASPNAVGPGCLSLEVPEVKPAPTTIPLPDMGIESLKNYLSVKDPTPFTGDCVADGLGGASDCTQGTLELGNRIITGNLIKPSNKNLKIYGPVWVQGNIILEANGSIQPRSDITSISQMVLASGTISSESNLTYGKNGTAFLMFISEFDPIKPIDLICDSGSTHAIQISSNSESVLFYSTKGCTRIRANSQFYGAVLGAGILIDNNASINYDPALQTAIFGLTSSGGWKTTAFKEQ